MNLNNYRDIVKQSIILDFLAWNITSGEPLQVEWLENLIPILEPRTHYISIQTNSSLITKKNQNIGKIRSELYHNKFR